MRDNQVGASGRLPMFAGRPELPRFRPILGIVVLTAIWSCRGSSTVEDRPPEASLVITEAAVLDVRTGRVRENRTVVVTDGRISHVSRGPAPAASDTLAARGRLLTPGLIDTHSHLAYLLGDSVSAGGGRITRLASHPDSTEVYRRRYAEQYVPHGVTTVQDVGSAPSDVRLLLEWLEDPRPWAPMVLPSGGALVSHEEGWTPFPGHREVTDPADARRWVGLYHDMGIRHLKLYWRLARPELEAAVAEAERLGLIPTAHIDYQVVPLDTVLALGVTSFEHAYTLAVGAMTRDEFLSAWRVRLPEVVGSRTAGRFYLGVMEYFHELGPDHPGLRELIDRLAEEPATVTPTLHLFAQRLGLAYFEEPPMGEFDDMSGLTGDQVEHFREGYRIMADYVLAMHRAGIRLTVGTDWVSPGRATLSEMLLLHDAGLSMTEVFRAATVDGAQAVGLADTLGTVEVGRRADLVLFHGNPLGDPLHLIGPKTVLKGGVIVASPDDGSGPGDGTHRR